MVDEVSSTAMRERPPVAASSSSTAGSTGRCIAASAPRCRWNPVSCSSNGSAPTNTGTSGNRSYSGANLASHFSLMRKERGAIPASIAREMTSKLSAMNRPRSTSTRERSFTSVMRR